MKQERIETYERSLDAAMVVAIGKLILYSAIWEELKTKLAKRRLKAKEAEMLKRQLKQIINDLDDRLFFVSPDKASSEEDVRNIMASRIRTGNLTDRVIRHLKSNLESAQSDLVDYLQDPSG
jgi:hypothetical protein